MNNKYIPINVENLILFLKQFNIDTNNMEINGWLSLIDESYCKYFDGKKICCTKIRGDNIFCSKHIKKKLYINDNESVISEQTLVDTFETLSINNINLKNTNDKTNLKMILNDNNLDIFLEMLENTKNSLILYKNNKNSKYDLYDIIINFRKMVFENNDETFVEISYIAQYFETINDMYNDLKNTFLLNNKEKWIEILEKWKDSMNEIIEEVNIIPNEYILINNK